MSPIHLQNIIILLLPTFSAVMAFIFIYLDSLKKWKQERNLRFYILAYLVCIAINWSSNIIYFYSPENYIYINALIYITFVMVQIFLYRFIFEITRTDSQERFSFCHYIAPGIIAVTIIAISLITPADQQIEVVKGMGVFKGGSYLFYCISTSKFKARLIFSIVYTIMAFYRVHQYRIQITNYSANDKKNKLRWISLFLFFSVALIPIPLMGIFLERSALLQSFITIIHAIGVTSQVTLLTYYISKGEYIIIEQENPIDTTSNTPINETINTHTESDIPTPTNKTKLLTQEQFDLYMSTNKPHLNPDLKITDLAESLGINRSYISSFINTQYNVNFNTLINQYRLEEYNLLQSQPQHAQSTKQELAQLAGFSTYKSYQRTVAAAPKEQLTA